VTGFSLAAGVAAGLVHVFSGPDHLAAVAPLAAGGGRGHWKAGLQWGLGHTAGVLLVGLALLVVREQIPVPFISLYSERLVGLALIAVGAWGAWKAMRLGVHPHAHPHTAVSFAMGALHGLAGSSHLFGVLPALAFPTRGDAVLYLVSFGVGAIGGMTAFAAAMGQVSTRMTERGPHTYRNLLYACSAVAVVVGGVWLSR
jgi:hypothetical protein